MILDKMVEVQIAPNNVKHFMKDSYYEKKLHQNLVLTLLKLKDRMIKHVS